MNQNKKRTPLNTRDPRVQELSQQYNIAPKAVAYIRAAIGSGRYNRNTLIEHIEYENKGRFEAIERHKTSTVFTRQQKEDLIKYTEINIKFRNGVAELLETMPDNVLSDLLT